MRKSVFGRCAVALSLPQVPSYRACGAQTYAESPIRLFRVIRDRTPHLPTNRVHPRWRTPSPGRWSFVMGAQSRLAVTSRESASRSQRHVII